MVAQTLTGALPDVLSTGEAGVSGMSMTQSGMGLGNISDQVISRLLIMMWMLIGIEGARVIGARRTEERRWQGYHHRFGRAAGALYRRERPVLWRYASRGGAPQTALVIVGFCAQVFFIIASFAEDTYAFAISMCTATTIISWTLAACYQIKLGLETHDAANLVFGVIVVVFQVVAVILSGWTFMILVRLVYVSGFFWPLGTIGGLARWVPAQKRLEWTITRRPAAQIGRGANPDSTFRPRCALG